VLIACFAGQANPMASKKSALYHKMGKNFQLAKRLQNPRFGKGTGFPGKDKSSFGRWGGGRREGLGSVWKAQKENLSQARESGASRCRMKKVGGKGSKKVFFKKEKKTLQTHVGSCKNSKRRSLQPREVESPAVFEKNTQRLSQSGKGKAQGGA